MIDIPGTGKMSSAPAALTLVSQTNFLSTFFFEIQFKMEL